MRDDGFARPVKGEWTVRGIRRTHAVGSVSTGCRRRGSYVSRYNVAFSHPQDLSHDAYVGENPIPLPGGRSNTRRSHSLYRPT
ncbi:protein of unknown function [Nitrospira defluvii]|uniref:Uncharacterized protein n=1 Tax=Nitrospira defluvii TaxID=330214 RepID=D8PB20_9BACT|nr:protein of unknown function [Nitrospira defluvii]